MLKNKDVPIFGLKLKNMSNFHSLEDVGRGTRHNLTLSSLNLPLSSSPTKPQIAVAILDL